ncbi:MAG: histidinol-phosphatase [Chryseolinea sp.]
MHSNYCDGKGELKEYVHQALKNKMISIGFSSHAPVPFQSVWCMKRELLDRYLREIDTLDNTTTGIEIYKGLEVDFVPGLIGPTDFAQKLDYTIGSIHFVDAFDDGKPWEIDGTHSVFLEGLDKIFSGDIKKAIARYYDLTREMIATSRPTILGHMDKIKFQNIDNKFFLEKDQWYQEEIDHTLDVVMKSGVIVEVNTRGLYQGKSSTPYPSPWILEQIHKKQIPIMLNSDTHHPKDMINLFPEMAVLLHEIGFKTLNVLYQGQWQPYSFNSNGIIIN